MPAEHIRLRMVKSVKEINFNFIIIVSFFRPNRIINDTKTQV